MIDEIAKQGLSTLLGQGTGWVLFTLSLVVIYILVKKIDELHKAAEKLALEQFEKRLAEFAKILEAMNRATDAMISMRVSVDARTEALNNLIAGFANLVRDLEANRERWADKGEQWSRQLDEMRGRLEDIQGKLK